MNTPANDSVAFLVRFAGSFYFVGRDNHGEARGSWAPSFGTAMTYQSADAVARQLRKMGHNDAIVTDILGRIATPEDIADAIEPTTTEEFQQVWVRN